VIPRNHLVEAALEAAAAGDLAVLQRLVGVLATPYDHERDLPAFQEPDPSRQPYRTFCGT
jgi:serine/tyrosine/threonine adenylyltransferase